MPGIILQTQAVKIIKKKLNGTDYVVFYCPDCGRRNHQSMYESIGNVGNKLSFKCRMCRREVELARPQSPIILPEPPKSVGLLGPDGKPL